MFGSSFGNGGGMIGFCQIVPESPRYHNGDSTPTLALMTQHSVMALDYVLILFIYLDLLYLQ